MASGGTLLGARRFESSGVRTACLAPLCWATERLLEHVQRLLHAVGQVGGAAAEVLRAGQLVDPLADPELAHRGGQQDRVGSIGKADDRDQVVPDRILGASRPGWGQARNGETRRRLGDFACFIAYKLMLEAR